MEKNSPQFKHRGLSSLFIKWKYIIIECLTLPRVKYPPRTILQKITF